MKRFTIVGEREKCDACIERQKWGCIGVSMSGPIVGVVFGENQVTRKHSVDAERLRRLPVLL